jgi:Rod binding domain-containing protein
MDSQNSLQLAKMKNSSQEVREYAFKMEAVKKNLTPPVDKEKKLRESCEGFEAIFIQKMWEQMRATIPEGGVLKGREEKFWQGMYDQELSKTMAGAGGIGLADMMYEQLSRSLRIASTDTADAMGGRAPGFAENLAPAPLLQGQAAAPKDNGAKAEAPANAGAPARQHQPAALAGLYAEAGQPDAPGESSAPLAPGGAVPPGAAHPASGATAQPVASVAPVAEEATDPAIVAVLNALRAAHHATPPSHPADGQQARGLSLGARPPLPPMQGDEARLGEQATANYISTLSKPVHKPVSGKRTVMPRAASGPRAPADQPVHRNLPFAGQEMQQAQAQGRLENSSPAPADMPKTGG